MATVWFLDQTTDLGTFDHKVSKTLAGETALSTEKQQFKDVTWLNRIRAEKKKSMCKRRKKERG